MEATTTTKTAAPTALVNGLNEDLRREFQAIVRYTQFAACVQGPHRPQFAELFRREIADELRHAHFLADKIAALGGEPTTLVPPIDTAPRWPARDACARATPRMRESPMGDREKFPSIRRAPGSMRNQRVDMWRGSCSRERVIAIRGRRCRMVRPDATRKENSPWLSQLSQEPTHNSEPMSRRN